MNFTPRITAIAVLTALTFGSAANSAISAPEQADKHVINLLTDCSHDYSFDLSNAGRNQSKIFKDINCLTSGQTIYKLNLEPINALVVLTDGKMPYSPKDAPYLLEYVKQGGGLYIGASTGGAYGDSLKAFLAGFGLLDEGTPLSEDPAEMGISAHAPSELIYTPERDFKRFKSSVGLWSHAGGSVIFEVYGDDQLLYQSPTMSKGQRENIDVSIAGVSQLRLVVTDAGNGNGSDASVWYDPHFTAQDGTRERVLLKDAKSAKVGWASPAQDQHFSGDPLSGKKAETQKHLKPGLYPKIANSTEWPEVTGIRSPRPVLQLKEPKLWNTIYENEKGEPIVMVRRVGNGFIVSDSAGLYRAAVGEKAPQQAIMQRLIERISSKKQVAAVKGGGHWQFSDGYRWELIKTTDDGLRIHHNEYSSIYLDSDIRAYKETVKYLTQITGLNEKLKAAQIKELNDLKSATMSGAAIDIDVSGVKTLTLIAEDGGNGNGFDHSMFADSRLYDRYRKATQLTLSDAVNVKSGYGKPLENHHPDGSPLSIGGKQFPNTILLHASGQMSFELNGDYKRFTTHVGASDRAGASVNFRIMGDGKELWNDGIVYTGGFPGGNPNDINYIPDGILFQLKYVACVGAGFLIPQGSVVDLPPALKDDWQVHLGMLSHEMGHAWAYPFTERLGEEGSAFIFNNLILHKHNGQRHGDSVTKRLTGYLKQHPDLESVDLATTRSDFKYYMFLDLMIREYGEEVWKNYQLLKYALLNKEGAVWDAHSTAWLWSIAIGTDAFPHFQKAFGSNMDKSQVQLPKAAMHLGFDPEAIGKLYGVPLKKLPQLRDIFNKLDDFSDVRQFYADELAEKGHPKVEG